MTGILIAAVLFGTGVALIVRAVFPAPARLDAVIAANRLQSRLQILTRIAPPTRPPASVRLGTWLDANIGHTRLAIVAPTDLALLDMTGAELMVRRVVFAAIGLCYPTLITLLALGAGVALPFAAPPLIGLVCGTVGWLLPGIQLRGSAQRLRRTFTDDLTIYTDLIVLQRAAGTVGAAQMIAAATQADTWAFARIQHAIATGRIVGLQPWDALIELSNQIGVPALAEVARVVHASVNEDTAINDSLQVRADVAREASLSQLQADAARASVKMTLPIAMMGGIFLIIFGFPAVVPIFQGSP